MKRKQLLTVSMILIVCFAFVLTGVSAALADFVPQDNPGGQQLRGVYVISEDDVYAVGNYGTVLHYDGADWSAETFPSSKVSCYTAWASASDDVFISADKGEIYHNDGTGWTKVYTGSNTKIKHRTVWGLAADDVYVGGDSGTLLHYDGSSWSPMTVPEGTTTIQGFWGTSSSNIYAVGGIAKEDSGDEAFILYYDGTAWNNVWTGTAEQKSSLLIVEDDEDAAELMCLLLNSLGYEADIALNGQQALEKVANAPAHYAHVLMDLHLPDTDGYELTAAIAEVAPNLKVTIISGAEPDKDRLEGLPIAQVLLKPVSKADLAVLNFCG